MSPGIKSLCRQAGVPFGQSEPVRRKYGSRLIGIVTFCLLPLLAVDVPHWMFILSQVIWGAGIYVGLSVVGDHARST